MYICKSHVDSYRFNDLFNKRKAHNYICIFSYFWHFCTERRDWLRSDGLHRIFVNYYPQGRRVDGLDPLGQCYDKQVYGDRQQPTRLENEPYIDVNRKTSTIDRAAATTQRWSIIKLNSFSAGTVFRRQNLTLRTQIMTSKVDPH